MRNWKLLAALIAIGLVACRSADDFVARGNEFFEKDQFAEASLQYQKAIQKDPGHADAYYRLALAEIERRNAREAFQALRRSVDLAPENAEARYMLADMAIASYVGEPASGESMYELAAEIASTSLEREPESADALSLSGRLALVGGRFSEAADLFAQAVAAAPDRGALYPPYLHALYSAGRAQEAERVGEQAIEAHPTVGAIYDVIYGALSQAGRTRDALALLERKIAASPDVVDYRIQLASHWARAGDEAAMNAVLQALLDRSGDRGAARMAAGDFLAGRGDRDRAVSVYREGAAAEPSRRGEFRLKIARALLAQGQADAALRELGGSIADEPSQRDARTLRADILVERGSESDLRSAVEDLLHLQAEDPNDADTDWRLGRAYLALNDGAAARRALQQAARKRRDFVEPRLVLAGLSLQERKAGDALSYANDVLALSPEHPRAMLFRADAEMDLNRLDDARATVDSLARRFPNAPEVRFQQAQIAMLENRYPEAERILSELDARQADPRTASALAEVYVRTRQNERALALVHKKLAATPDSPSLRRLLAETAASAGDLSTAAAEFQRLAEGEPSSPVYPAKLGSIRRMEGDLEAAAAQFRRAAERAPTEAAPLLALGSTLEECGRPAEAMETYRKALALQPENPLAMNNLAFLLAESGELNEASELAARASALMPDQPSLRDTLGWVYLKQGRGDSALQVFAGLARQHPENAVFRYHHGAALAAVGRGAEAREELRSARTLGLGAKDNAEAERLLAGLGPSPERP